MARRLITCCNARILEVVLAGVSRWQRNSGRRGILTLVAAWAALTAAPLACSDATDNSDCSSVFGGDTSVLTWWRAVVTAEGQAQQALVDGYARCSGGEVTIEPAADTKEDALQSYESNDKHLLLVNGFSDIDRLECTAQRGSGLFALKDMHGFEWNDRIPTFLQPYVRPCNGSNTNRLFAIPVGLHTLNRTLVNAQFADAFRGEVTPDAFLDILTTLSEQLGHKPIVVPADIEPSYLLVENIMVAVAGERYRDFWNMARRTNSETDIDMAPFEDTLDYADKLLPFVEFVGKGEANPTGLAMSKLCNGEAALTVQADWVDPANYCGDKLVAAPFPGTAHYSVFAFDAFAVDYSTEEAGGSDAEAGFLPERAPEYAWLKAVTSADVQAEYAKFKGSRLLIKRDASGKTVALTEQELFGDDVTPLPGLLLVVEHTIFKDFRAEIDDYFTTAITDPAALQDRKAALVEYVHDEMCKATTCDIADTR